MALVARRSWAEDVSLDASNLRARARRERIDELVFCAADLSAAHHQWMERLKRSRAQIDGQPAAPSSDPTVRGKPGRPARPGAPRDAQRRRATDEAHHGPGRGRAAPDLGPLTIWLVKDRAGLIGNARGVLLGRYTWVGYAGNPVQRRLPVLAPAVLGNLAAWPATSTRVSADRMDLLYARTIVRRSMSDASSTSFDHRRPGTRSSCRAALPCPLIFRPSMSQTGYMLPKMGERGRGHDRQVVEEQGRPC